MLRVNKRFYESLLRKVLPRYYFDRLTEPRCEAAGLSFFIYFNSRTDITAQCLMGFHSTLPTIAHSVTGT